MFNSPLSEFAAVGFEYGYSVAAPEALVLWEAQFGDFVNGAQIAIDQFIVAGLSKWGQTSRLTLLLPHGYEGKGPEHSSARLERFLQLAAQENIRIVNPTTAAQSFHLLRRQALDPSARPLIVMTPKGLLRLRAAMSSLEDLSDGAFRPVIDDAETDHAKARRLASPPASSTTTSSATRPAQPRAMSRSRASSSSTRPRGRSRRARARLQLARGDHLGAGRAAEHGRVARDPAPPRRRRLCRGLPVRFVGRPWRASPSEGYPTAHLREQDRIVREALGVDRPRKRYAAAAAAAQVAQQIGLRAADAGRLASASRPSAAVAARAAGAARPRTR